MLRIHVLESGDAGPCPHDVSTVLDQEWLLCDACGELLAPPDLRDTIVDALRKIYGKPGN